MSNDAAALPPQGSTEAATLAALEQVGYTADFEILDSGLHLDAEPIGPDRVIVDRTYRFEGPSDPEYESLIIALHERDGDRKGTLVTAYGPSASAMEAEILRQLRKAPRDER